MLRHCSYYPCPPSFTTFQFSKIAKVMRHVVALSDDKVPRDSEFKFRERAQKLVDKWHQILNAVKVNGGGNNGTPANGAAGTTTPKEEIAAPAAASDAAPATEEKAKTANGDDTEMADVPTAAPAGEVESTSAAVDKDVAMDGAVEKKESHPGDVSALPDVTMSEAGAETA
jgi:nucleoid-associated protein YgaU